MSSRTFQGVSVQMKDATDRSIGVIDSEGTVIASTELATIGTQIGSIFTLPETPPDRIAVIDGRTYKMIGGSDSWFDYAIYVEGTDDFARSVCQLACIAVNEAKVYYEEKFDKAALVKNIITDNILPGDIYVHAKELHFITDISRGVFLVRQVDKADVAAVEILQKMFNDRQHDFVISVSETDIAVIKEIPPNTEPKDLYKIALTMEQAIATELDIKTVIGIGTPAMHLRELADRYKEAQVAIDVGKVFETEKSIINYENLGIGRLIYQLPTTLCEMFLSEVFKKSPLVSLDKETLDIITKFFENNLNIPETSRKLFVHRNTLVYSLGKIKKLTGLDLREFEQAIGFKVALMVNKYLNSPRM
jgi:carbohydrate diacid regulator